MKTTLLKTWTKSAACAAFAAALAAGCGGKPELAPRAPEGTAAALMLDYREAAKVPQFKQEMQKSLASVADMLPKELAGLKPLLERQNVANGLKWCVLTVGNVSKFEEGKPVRVPDVGLAVALPKADGEACRAEIEKALDSSDELKEAKKELQAGVEIADAEIAGCKAWKLVFKGDAVQALKAAKLENLAPCGAWLGEDLFLAASNEKALADLIALHRDGAGASGKFAFGKALCCGIVAEPGRLAAQQLDDDDLKGAPGGAAFIKSLTDLRLTVGLSEDGKRITYAASVMTGDAKVAKELREQVTGLLAMGKMGMAAGEQNGAPSDDAALAKALFDSVKIEGEADIRVSFSLPLDQLMGRMKKEIKKQGGALLK